MKRKFISNRIIADIVIKGICTIILFIPAIAISGQWETFSLRDNGAIPVWTVAGSFPSSYSGTHGDGCFGYYKDYLVVLGGEKNANPVEDDRIILEDGNLIVWRTVFSNPSGLLNYLDILGVGRGIPGVAYTYCQLVSDKKQQVVLKIRSDDGVRAWLNHQMIHDHHLGRSVTSEEDMIPVVLKKGNNPLLVKVDQGRGDWGLAVSVTDLNGMPAQGIFASIFTIKPLKGKIKEASFQASPLVLGVPHGNRQIIIGEILSGGLKNLSCCLTKKEWENPVEMRLGDIPPGKFNFQIKVPVIKKTGTIQAVLQSSTDQLELPEFIVQKPREWVVYLVQHEHTDIGYTRSQNEMLPENLRFIDYALDYCDLTDDYPDDAKFRWTCEVSYPVREYLKRRPQEQIERLKRRVAEGRIEITGMFLNMSEISTESELVASVQPIRDFKMADLPVKTAMQNDVNGIAWCLADYLSDIGVKYLTMGINHTRSTLPFDKPTVFWWESPSGKRLLAYRPDHYHTANYWSVHEGNVEFFQSGIIKYLESLEKRNYPFDRIAVQYNGSHTDNAPPSTGACDLVKIWNKTYVWPKLRLATAQEFLQYIEMHHGGQLPIYRVAWPDWWTDGFGSAARETAFARKTHRAIQTDQALLSMAALLGTHISTKTMARVTDVQDDLLFYDEHTFGADVSISDPMAERSMVQWEQKSSYVWAAVKNEALIREEALGLLQPYLPRAEVPNIVVFNTLNWQRSGLVELFIDHELLPANARFQIIDSENVEEIPAQLMRSRKEGSYWALYVNDIPPLGYKSFRIEVSDKIQELQLTDARHATVMENAFYRLLIDAKTGAVTSLHDKEWGLELVDQTCVWSLGQLIYEKTLEGRDFKKHNFKRSSLKNINSVTVSEGAIWKNLHISADIDGCKEPNGVQLEIRLYNTEKRIEFLFNVRKQRITDPEAYYVAFPFNLSEAKIVYEAQGGFVTPGKTQLPGSASDWQTIQSFAAVRNKNGQIIFSSNQVPLVQFGDINLGKWQYVALVEKPHLYSWVMNNYWYTNFRAFQEGELKWSFTITSNSDTSNTIATHFGWNSCMPLIARAFPPGSNRNGKSSLSTIKLDTPNVVLVNAKPAFDENGVILHLREVEGKSRLASFKDEVFSKRVKSVHEVNVLEEVLAPNITEISFNPFEVKFIKLMLD